MQIRKSASHHRIVHVYLLSAEHTNICSVSKRYKNFLAKFINELKTDNCFNLYHDLFFAVLLTGLFQLNVASLEKGDPKWNRVEIMGKWPEGFNNNNFQWVVF